MFEIMYLIFLIFVMIIAVAVCIYEICCRRDAEKREAEAIKDADSEKSMRRELQLRNSKLFGECGSLEAQYNAMRKDNKQIVTDNAVLRCQLDEAIKVKEEYAAANKALKERNFDDIMSLFECTIGEDGEECYRKGSVYLIVRDGKCVEALSILDSVTDCRYKKCTGEYERPTAEPVPCEACGPDEDWKSEPVPEEKGGEKGVNNSSTDTQSVTLSPAREGSGTGD